MIRRFFAILALALAATAPAHPSLNAAPAKIATTVAATADDTAYRPVFSADDVRTDKLTGEYVGTVNVSFSHGIARLTADEVRFNPKTGIATARGHVVFTRGPMRLLADELTYKASDGAYAITAPRLGEFPYFISAQQGTGTADALTLTDATVTYDEPGPFTPTFRSGSLVYTRAPQASIQSSDTRIGVGPVTLVKLPKLGRGVRQPAFISNATARVGYRGNLGAFLDLGTRVPVTDGLRLGGDIGFYSKRGLLFGPGAAYDITTEDGQRITGTLDTGYIHDYGTRLTDILGAPVPPDRGFITWRHDQTITPDLRIFAQANYWSDSEIIRDFRSGQFYPVQQPDNFIEADYKQPNYIISVFARARFNPYYPVQQRLPEVRFDLLPSPIGVQGIIQKAQASVAALNANTPTPAGDTSVDSHRADIYYALERPIAHKDIATLTPIVGARLTHYADATGGKDNYTRFLGEIGFDAALRAAGTFDYKNKNWDINGLRHLITPRLSYRYIPQADKGTPYIPAVDDQTFSTYLQPIGLGEIRNIDEVSPTNVFRIGLDNTLQTRDKNYGSRDLAILNFAADYHLDETQPAGTHAFSAIHADLALMPAPWLRFNLYQSFTPQDFTLRELNTGFAIHDGSLWSVGLSTHYLKDQINEYIAEGRYRLNEAYEAYARVHYDARERRFNERSVGIIQKLGHNLWTIRYGVTFYEGHTRESNFGFSLEVRLANF